MIIAVPVEDNEVEICPSFGRTPLFYFYDTETETGEFVENEAMNAPGGAGIKAAQTVIDAKAEVVLVKGETTAVVDEINRLAAEDMAHGFKTGVMATEETKDLYQADIILSLGSRDRPEEIGANLFKFLRKFDFLGAERVYSEVFSEKGEGMAIMNRLNKAAGYQTIDLDEK